MPLKALLFLFIFSIFAFGALYDPILGACGYLFVYYTYSHNIWWVKELTQYTYRFPFIMALFLAIGMILKKRQINYTILPYNKLETCIYLFVGIIALSLILAGIPPFEDSYYLFKKMINISIFIFMFTRVVNNYKKYNMIVFIIIVTGVYLGLQAFFSPSSRFLFGRLDAIGGVDFAGANEFATHLGVVLCFLGTAFLKSNKWLWKLFCIIGIAFVFNAIILTRSRGVFIAIFATAFYAIIFAPKQWRKQLFICLILGAILFFMLVDPKFFSRMGTIKDTETLSTERLVIWKASIKMLEDYPLGVGVGNFKIAIGNYDDRISDLDAHNTFIRCYGELGIQGLALFILLIILIFRQLKHIKNLIWGISLESRFKMDIYALSLAIMIYLLGGFFHTRLYIEDMWVLFAMPICLEKALLHEIDNEEVKNESISN